MKRTLKILFYCLCGLIVLIVGYFMIQSKYQQAALDRYIKDLAVATDRIEIVYQDYGSSPSSAKSFEFVGSDVGDFFSCLKFRFPLTEEWCKCSGNPIVRFYSKGKVAGEFTIHHDNSIRCERFRVGNIPFLDANQKKLLAFFLKHKINAPE